MRVPDVIMTLLLLLKKTNPVANCRAKLGELPTRFTKKRGVEIEPLLAAYYAFLHLLALLHDVVLWLHFFTQGSPMDECWGDKHDLGFA